MPMFCHPGYFLQAALFLLLVLLYWRDCEVQRSPYLRPTGNGYGDGRPPFYPGVPKASVLNYSRIIVVPKIVDEDVD